jgi:peroxiredoxin
LPRIVLAFLAPAAIIASIVFNPPATMHAQANSPDDTAIVARIKALRSQPDAARGKETGDIALAIGQLPASDRKVMLALGLAHLSTEGDPGRDNLQAVTTTLASAVAETPARPNSKTNAPNGAYTELAELERYEHMTIDPAVAQTDQYKQAVNLLITNDAEIEKQDFTLKDLHGKKWTLSQLHGKIVVVNFWATWCPPCRKELPDLDAIYTHFKSQDLIILGLDDEDPAKISQFLGFHELSYPVLLDSGRKTADAFHVGGIPKTFVFNREGKLVAQSIDMRTQRQFLNMLSAAGLKPQ